MSELTVEKKDNKNKNKINSLDNPLKEINGFSKLMDYFTDNNRDNWKKWLQFEQTFDKHSKFFFSI